MNFSTKKRPRKDAWRDLQKELDERERVEEVNAEKFKTLDALKARTAIEEEADPERAHAYMDIVIGRNMGKDPKITKGRLIFELFDDIMPRTVEQFVRMLSSPQEPTYHGSTISEVFPGFKCQAGDRESRVEGAASGRDAVYSRVEAEANWQARPTAASAVPSAQRRARSELCHELRAPLERPVHTSTATITPLQSHPSAAPPRPRATPCLVCSPRPPDAA